MSEENDFTSFFKANSKLVRELIDLKLETYRLRAIKLLAVFAGSLIWAIAFFMLLFLLTVFGGLVTGFWLSEITGSYKTGFGLATLLILLIVILVTALRKQLFINPLVRRIIKVSKKENS